MSDHSFASQEPFSPAISRYTLLRRVQEICRPLLYRPGIYSRNELLAAGFKYTGDGDTAQCNACGLEVSGWTTDMIPFTIHSERSPHCPFVRDMKSSIPLLSITAVPPITSVLNQPHSIIEHRSIESVDLERSSHCLIENDQLQRVRKRTMSHLPCDFIVKMIEAGFFHCNVGTAEIQDRVMCIYCDLMCQNWTQNVDDPCDVHKIFSPNCEFVKRFLIRHGPICILNGDGRSMTPIPVDPSYASNHINPSQIGRSARRDAQNRNHGAIQNNVSSSNQSLSDDDCVLRSHLNTDNKDMAFCSSCGRAFRELNSNEHPMIDHARQFPSCPYVKQLRLSNYPEQDTVQHGNGSNAVLFMDDEQLARLDKDTLSTLAINRLKRPMSRKVLNRGYSLYDIQKCWEDQLRLRGHDFITALDLEMACFLRRKQICCIHHKNKKVIIPGASMRQLRKRQAAEAEEVQAKRRATAADDN